MDFFKDWHFWISALQILGICGLAIYHFLTHQKIVTNDLHHVQTSLNKMEIKQEKQDATLVEISTNIAYLKGKQDTESAVLGILKDSLKK